MLSGSSSVNQCIILLPSHNYIYYYAADASANELLRSKLVHRQYHPVPSVAVHPVTVIAVLTCGLRPSPDPASGLIPRTKAAPACWATLDKSLAQKSGICAHKLISTYYRKKKRRKKKHRQGMINQTFLHNLYMQGKAIHTQHQRLQTTLDSLKYSSWIPSKNDSKKSKTKKLHVKYHMNIE